MLQYCEERKALCDGEIICGNCEYYKKPNMQTNADRIRAMSDEELAKIIVDEICLYCQTYRTEECYNKCISAQVKWLKQPAEVD